MTRLESQLIETRELNVPAHCAGVCVWAKGGGALTSGPNKCFSLTVSAARVVGVDAGSMAVPVQYMVYAGSRGSIHTGTNMERN